MVFETLDGVATGRYVVTTHSGTRHVLDLDQRVATRYGADGHIWGSQVVRGELGGGGSRPKAFVTVEDITPDGEPLYFTDLINATVGECMFIANTDEWRRTSRVESIEELHGDDNGI